MKTEHNNACETILSSFTDSGLNFGCYFRMENPPEKDQFKKMNREKNSFRA